MNMTGFELRAALDEMGISQSALAALCGVAPLEVWRWADGRTPVPGYATTILSMLKLNDPISVLNGRRAEWNVERHHVFRNKKSFADLLKRWHPDYNRKRDTTREMQFVLKFRN